MRKFAILLLITMLVSCQAVIAHSKPKKPMARPPNHVCVYKDVKVSAFVNSPKKGMQTVHLHYQDVLVAIMIGETTSKDPISILLKPVGLEKLLPVPQILRRRLLPDPDINTAGLVIMQNPEIFENCEK